LYCLTKTFPIIALFNIFIGVIQSWIYIGRSPSY